MKKAIAILLAALMLLSVLSACGAETKTDVSAKQKRIAVICGTVGTNLFLTQIVDEVKSLQSSYNYDYSIIECSDADEWQTNYESAVMAINTIATGLTTLLLSVIFHTKGLISEPGRTTFVSPSMI